MSFQTIVVCENDQITMIIMDNECKNTIIFIHIFVMTIVLKNNKISSCKNYNQLVSFIYEKYLTTLSRSIIKKSF